MRCRNRILDTYKCNRIMFDSDCQKYFVYLLYFFSIFTLQMQQNNVWRWLQTSILAFSAFYDMAGSSLDWNKLKILYNRLNIVLQIKSVHLNKCYNHLIKILNENETKKEKDAKDHIYFALLFLLLPEPNWLFSIFSKLFHLWEPIETFGIILSRRR